MALIEKRNGLGYSGILTFINSLGLDYVSVSGSTVNIDNHLSLSFSMNAVYLTVNSGSSTRISRVDENCTVTISYSNTLFSLNVVDSSSRAYAVIYEKINGVNFYGWNGNQSNWTTYHGFYTLEEITMYNLTTGEAYARTKRLNYPAPFGKIDYAPNALFKGGYRDVTDRNFTSCSTITANQVITFNNINYYSIGTNTLVSIDQI